MQPAPRLVLASTSPYRRELLARLGVPFSARAPTCDEEALKVELRGGGSPAPPGHLAAALARAKAESLRDVEPGAVILGADQVAALGDEIFGKPGSAEQAAAQLARLAGRTHVLITGGGALPRRPAARARRRHPPLHAAALARAD